LLPLQRDAVTQPIILDESAVARIANTIRIVETGDRREQPLAFAAIPLAPRQQRTFRIATFTGAWAINAPKVVTFKYQTSTPNTVVATNLFCGLSPATTPADVAIAKEGTGWFLVQPNLTQQPGYSASGTQVLTIQNGVLRWIGTTAC